MKRVLYETHMHTPLCRHAVGEPEEYAEAAYRRGFQGIIVTDHNPVPNWTVGSRMTTEDLPKYFAMVERARNNWKDKCDVRLGLESDWHPGMEVWLEKLHAKAPFNYILGSVHPQANEYKALYLIKGEVLAYQRLYFDHLAQAAETKLFDCLAHPDLVKNVFPTQWDPLRILDDIKRNLDRIAKTGVSMELNTSGLNKDVPEMNPGRPILEQMFARRIPVVVGADAHKPQRTGAEFERALRTLLEVGYKTVNVYLERRPHPVDIAEALETLVPV